MARDKVVVQFKAEKPEDFDRLLKIEETLIQAFSQSTAGVVDGHDIGQGTFNIFIHPRNAWGPALERVEAFLKLRGVLDEAVIAKFHGKSERYQVVHPATHRDGFAL